MAGLLDFLQAASNTAASNISGPVDMLAWALDKVGVPGQKKPVMGSAWLKEQGLMRDVPQSAASLAGETVGLLGPMGVAAKAPQIAAWRNAVNELAESGAGRMPRGAAPRGAITWHGSPHKFVKFDSSKMGTGEGAQSYGQGTYLADQRGVGSTYTKADQPTLLNGQVLDEMNPAHIAAAGLHVHKGNAEGAIADMQWAMQNPALFPESLVPVYKNAIGLLRDKAELPAVAGGTGHLYKVDLPDEMIARMLDWDKPLSQQVPRVQEALRQVVKPGWVTGAMGERRYLDPLRTQATGGKLLEMLKQLQRGQPEESLRQAGVPGVRYLDGNSRGAGVGSSNYVVFPGEEGALKILERNGKGLLD